MNSLIYFFIEMPGKGQELVVNDESLQQGNEDIAHNSGHLELDARQAPNNIGV